MPTSSPLRWGFLGTSQIARTEIGPALQQTRSGMLVAVGSRSEARASALAQQLGAARVHGSYEALLADPEVEAIYLSLPNALHHDWTLKALRAGKHVLCEKPLALYERDAAEMAEAARQAGRVLMEGFMYRFHSRLARVQELLATGTLGDVRLVKATYVFRLAHAQDVRAGGFEEDIRLRPDLGGGALFDVGSYCVNALRWYMHAEPHSVLGWAERSAGRAVEMRCAGLLDFGEGRVGEFFCAMDTFGGGHVEIFGERGRIVIPLAFRLRPSPPVLELRIETVDGTSTEEFPYANQYVAELEAFAAAVRSGGPAPIPAEDSVRNVAVLEALRGSWSAGPSLVRLGPAA